MIVIDTGVLLAAADSDDQDHDRCAQLVRDHHRQLAVPAPVIVETSWQIERNLGAASEAGFLGLVIGGEVEVINLSIDDYRRCVVLIETYADMGLGLVDASVVAIAERLGISTIATLNRRDFTVVRAGHIEAFELLP
ncbi:MAG: type II toxin-antitoxin system VapC family toxin [Acidimicrobiales bacterium]